MLTAKALLKYTDLASLRVGILTQDGFLSLTVDYLAEQTGMALDFFHLKDLGSVFAP